MRLFVAVDPGERLRGTLATALDTWRGRWDLNWVRPENLHVTLRFLGEQPATALPGLEAALARAAAAHAPFTVTSGGLGVFPGWRRPRVLFLQLVQADELKALAASVGAASAACLGEDPAQGRALRAHLTLARIKRPPGAAALAALRDLAPPDPHPVAVDDLRLIESRLTPGGALYDVRRVFPLAGVGPA
jgi:2'-5' RNA ligase